MNCPELQISPSLGLRRDVEMIGRITQLLGWLLASTFFPRSSSNRDDTVFVEKTYMDLELQYGRSETGRPTFLFTAFSLPKCTRAFLKQLLKTQKGRPNPSKHVGCLEKCHLLCLLSYAVTRSTSSTGSSSMWNIQARPACHDLFVQCLWPGREESKAETEIKGTSHVDLASAEDGAAHKNTLGEIMDIMRPGLQEEEPDESEDETRNGDTGGGGKTKKGKSKRPKKVIDPQSPEGIALEQKKSFKRVITASGA